ncbi:MAG: hypothetical protein ABJB12_04850 [Pseudomonadota bacterium]
MSERRSSPDWGQNLEAALGSFPFPERDWEKDALAVEARLPQAGPTEAALLGAPLPSEPGEPNAPLSATATPVTHSGVRPQSLADMARRSVERKQGSEREMARESLALAAKRPSAVEVQALREVMNNKLAAAPPNAALVNAGAASNAHAARGVRVQGGAAQVPTRAKAPWSQVGLAAAGVALAAGVLFWLRQPGPMPPASTSESVLSSAQKTTAAAARANSVAPSAGQPNAAQAAAAQASAPTGVNPDTLPESEPAPRAHDKAVAGNAHAPAPSAPASGPRPAKIELEDEPERPLASAVPGRIDAAVPQALLADPALRPADSTGGAVPAKPSSGAVQAALGAVMSGARHCVAAEGAPSSALVVFGSDGRVQSVSVSGSAAGKPSGECIQAQLARARVQPFAASSFSVSATVRPD